MRLCVNGMPIKLRPHCHAPRLHQRDAGLNTRLRSVKHVNNTYYHYGVMAQWQMRGMWVE